MDPSFTKIPSDFWTTPQAKALRKAGTEVYFLALYLLTSPHANRLGVYYLPFSYISQDTDLPLASVERALAHLVDLEFCYYDEVTDYIWVCDMALYRVSRSLAPNDNQVKGIHRAYQNLPQSLPFLKAFYQKYQAIFHWPALEEASPLEAPSKPLRTYKNKKESKKESKNKRERLSLSGKPDGARIFSSSVSDLPEGDSEPTRTEKKTKAASLHSPSPKPTEAVLPTHRADTHLRSKRSEAKQILAFLNQKTGRSYREAESNLRLIAARLQSGVTPDQCRQVIAKKTREWRSRPEMVNYLRPATLFNATKFEQYVGELGRSPDDPTSGGVSHE